MEQTHEIQVRQSSATLPPLTERELEVLQCLPTRLSTVEIGARLRISPNTVKTHLKNIYQKLGARSRNEAILNAVSRHLISEDSAALVQH
jgi:LuxR family transcriptional regulator, maltose regulon positive regulatory protein